jgi:hypothetical protein
MTILYVQHDYAVFGFGETRQAIAMAAWYKRWKPANKAVQSIIRAYC